MKTTMPRLFAIAASAISSFGGLALGGSIRDAVESSDPGKVKQLLASGIDVNTKDNDGWTPVLFATWLRDRPMVELLLAKGADVNAKDNYGKTPLHVATNRGDKERS